QLREWLVRRARLWSGATRAGGAGAARAGGTRGTAAAGPRGARTRGTGAAGTGSVGGARAGDPTEPGATRAGGSGAGGAGAGGAGVEGTGAGGAGAGGTGAGGAGVGGTGAGGAGAGGAGAVDSRGTMRPRPYFVPLLQQCVFLPPPPESSLPLVPDPESEHARAASPTISRLLATAITDPSFDSAAASACRLDYATALVTESATPPSVGGECALGTDVLEDKQEDFECLAAAVPRFASMLLAPEGDPDAPDIPTLRSCTGNYRSLLLSVAGSHG
ncbi:unnamed protein product, partial [Closterium sp. NIES-54]